MHRMYDKFLFVFAVFLIIGGIYVYFSQTLSISAAENSGLSSSANSPVKNNINTENNKINQDTAFLATLVSLNKIKIDTTFVSSESFKSLVDNSVEGENVTPGRPNPFAPVDTTFSSTVSQQSLITETKNQ